MERAAEIAKTVAAGIADAEVRAVDPLTVLHHAAAAVLLIELADASVTYANEAAVNLTGGTVRQPWRVSCCG
jgi:uncharacterized protein (UPF0264 family)